MTPERIAELREFNYNATISFTRGEAWHEMLDEIDKLMQWGERQNAQSISKVLTGFVVNGQDLTDIVKEVIVVINGTEINIAWGTGDGMVWQQIAGGTA